MEEFDTRMVLLNHKLNGNPTVITDRIVSFLDLAVLMLDQKFFKKESTRVVIIEALRVRDKKMEDALKTSAEKKPVGTSDTMALALKEARSKVQDEEDSIVVDPNDYMNIDDAMVEVETTKIDSAGTTEKGKKAGPKKCPPS